MSRPFLIGILVLFVGLLFVMTYVVRRAAEPVKPSEDQTAQAAKQQQEQKKQQMEAMRERETQMRKQRAAVAAKENAQQQALKMQGKPVPKAPGAMDIEGKWDLRRPEGEAGIIRLQKEAKTTSAGAPPAPVGGPPAGMPPVPTGPPIPATPSGQTK